MKSSKSFDTTLLLAPAVILVILFFLIPAVTILVISFTNISTETAFHLWEWVGFANYEKIWVHPKSLPSLWITLKYVACTLVLFNVGMALLVALLSTSVHPRVGFFFRALWLLPRITPSVVYVLMWKYIGADAPFGIANSFLVHFGFTPQNWVVLQPFLFIVLINGYIGASFGMIIFTSAIESIPKDYFRAAMVDGASYWQQVRHIILPSIKWPLLFVVTFQTLSLLTSFEQILIFNDGAGGMEVWPLWAYHVALNNYWGYFQWGYGAALAGVLVVVGVVFCLLYMRFFKFNELVQEPKVDI